MKANVFYQTAVFSNVEVQTVSKNIVSFDIPMNDVTKQFVEYLTNDKNASMTFYKDCVFVILPKKEVEIVWL
jgi:hypothetical protein